MWDCATCDDQARALRGNCGGAFSTEMLRIYPYDEIRDEQGALLTAEGAYRDESGRIWVSGDTTLRAYEQMAGTWFASCPVAATLQPWVSFVWQAYRAWDKAQLYMLEPAPSAALLQAVDHLCLQVEALKAARMEDARDRR